MQTAALLWPLVTQPGTATSSNMNETLGTLLERYWQDDAVRWRVCCSPVWQGKVRETCPTLRCLGWCREMLQGSLSPAQADRTVQLRVWAVDAGVYISVREQKYDTLSLTSFIRPQEKQSGEKRKVLYWASPPWEFSFLVSLGKCSNHGKLIIIRTSIIKTFW